MVFLDSNMFHGVFLFIGIVNAWHGFPDSEERGFIYEKNNSTFIFLSTIPEYETFLLQHQGSYPSPDVALYSERPQPFTCPGNATFALISPNHNYEFVVQSNRFTEATATFTCPEKPDGEQRQIMFKTTFEPFVSFFCRPYSNQAPKQQELALFERTDDFDCPVMLYLGPSMRINRTAKYPKYRLPHKWNRYYMPGDGLPESYFQTESFKLTIDLINANNSDYVYYKGEGRPIPIIHLKFVNECNNVTVYVAIDLCVISLSFTKFGMSVNVDGAVTEQVSKFDETTLLVFTLTDVFVHSVRPLGMKHVGRCNFGDDFIDNTDFVMKTWHFSTSARCTVKMIFVDDVLIQRKPNTSTVSTKIVEEIIEEVILTTIKPKAASAKFSKWYIIIPCVIVVIIIIVITGIVLFNIRKKMKSQKEKHKRIQQKSPPRTPSEVELPLDPTQDDDERPRQSIEVPEKQPPKKSESTKTKQKSFSAPAIRLRDPIVHRTGKKETLPPPPDSEKTVKASQNRTTVGTMTQQQTDGESTRIQKAANYHDKEPNELVPMEINFEKIEKIKPLTTDNFWQVMETAGEVARYSPVYVTDANDKFENVIFYVRDLKMLPGTPFKRLANRILEPMPKVTPAKDGQQRVAVRVFITSHVPLTIEIHMIGKPPEFIFNICDCKQCQALREELSKGRLFKALSIDPWPILLCRLKRLPVNHHCFVSVTNPTDKTKVHHIFILRGTKDPPTLLPCERECNIGTTFSHPNGFILKSNDQRTLTIKTEATQEDGTV